MTNNKKDHVSLEDLKGIGFVRKKVKYFCEMEQIEKEAVFYELSGRVNDSVYFNPEEKVYSFYYKTIIGDHANYVHLKIERLSDLITILRVFQFNF